MVRGVLLCVGLAVCAVPAVGGELVGGGSVLSAYDRDLIRKPLKGSLAGTPRVPSRAATDTPGVSLDLYAPGMLAVSAERPDSRFAPHARAAARRNGVPVDLFLRLVTQESGWNPNAVSHKGAIGLAQLMPATARKLRVDPRDPHQNLDGGARYLAEQYRKFRSWKLALAAYNAGPEAVERYNGVPPYRETRNYVAAILTN